MAGVDSLTELIAMIFSIYLSVNWFANHATTTDQD